MKRLAAPVVNEDLRATLGSGRRELAKAIEAWLPFAKEPLDPVTRRWLKTLEEMRRGLNIVAGAVRYIGYRTWQDRHSEIRVPLLGERYERIDAATPPELCVGVQFFSSDQIFRAQRWLDFHLGPPRGAHRPKDQDRVRVGVRVAFFFEQYGERFALTRQGLYAQTLGEVLRAIGYHDPKDRLHLLRRIRDERARVRTLPAFRQQQARARSERARGRSTVE